MNHEFNGKILDFNLYLASMATDNLKNTMVTVDAMKSANKELKSQYKKINLNKIEVYSSLTNLIIILENSR